MKTLPQPLFKQFAVVAASALLLSACGGGLVEQAQPSTSPPPGQSVAIEPIESTVASNNVLDSAALRAQQQDIEFLTNAAQAYAATVAETRKEALSNAPVQADISSVGAFLFEKKTTLNATRTDAKPVVTPLTASPIQIQVTPQSTLGTTFDFLSAQVASLTARVNFDGASRSGRIRPPAVTPPVNAPSPAPAPAPAPAVPTELRWSDVATWGGALPSAGSDIVIPAGRTILLDVNPAAMGALKIEGTLKFAARDIALTAASINVTGSLLIGSKSQAYRNKAVITLTGSPTSATDGSARGINVNGGELALYGTAPSPVWTKLNANAAAKSTNFVLRDSTNWNPGDVIAMAPTDFYGVSQTERFTITQANGINLSTNAGINQARWGVLQHVTSKGMSLTPEPGYVPPASPAPTVLDERAAVGNLSRNIVIQSVDDDAWRSSGFGVHLMFMDLKSKIVLDGVEIHRGGQAGITGRYPIHWHRLSYSDAGVAIGDATGHVMQNSTVWESSNRCVVIHATNGVTVKNNICHDIKGHAFFLEDAVERRNLFEGNLALMMRMPAEKNKLQIHEGDIYQGGPAGFWLTNPDNIVRGNNAGDAAGNGFWMAFPERPLGLSKSVPLYPNKMLHGVFEYNTAYTSRGPGLMLEWAPTDDAGNVRPTLYAPSVNPQSVDIADRRRFEIKGITSFKNLGGAYRNRVAGPDYIEWVTADNVGVSMAGTGSGVISRGLLIGQSLNNNTLLSTVSSGEGAAAFATYHSSFTMKDNTVVNFPFVEGQASGMFAMSDYYIFAVDTGQILNTNNRLVNSHPGQRSLPPNLDGRPLNNRNWTYSGAIWDPQGLWGPKNNYIVYDLPFLTSSGKCQSSDPIGKNGKSCEGPFYGVGSFQTDFDDNPFTFKAPIQIIRSNVDGSELGRWTVGDGEVSPFFGNMRHFAAQPNGVYSLTFPGKPFPTKFAMDVGNAQLAGDSFVFSVSFDGRIPVTGYTVAGFRYGRFAFWAKTDSRAGFARWFEPANSLNDVVQSTGNKIWQDSKNNTVWIRVQGGIPFPRESAIPFIDDQTYGALSIVLHPK